MRILITGTSSGIGKGIAEKFLSEGHCVTGFDRKEATIQHTALIYGKTVPFHPELSKLFGYQRIGEKETLTVLCSFSTEEIRVPLDTLIPKVVLNNKETFTMDGTNLVLAPYQAVVLASAAE